MNEKTYIILTTNAVWLLVEGKEKQTLRKVFNIFVPPPNETKIIEGKSIGLIPDDVFNKLRLFGDEGPDKPIVTLDILSAGDNVPLVGDCANEITKALEDAKKTGAAIAEYL